MTPEQVKKVVKTCQNLFRSNSTTIFSMVRGRESPTHKCARTTSNKIGSIFHHQREKSENHTLPGRQQSSLSLTFKNEGEGGRAGGPGKWGGGQT